MAMEGYFCNGRRARDERDGESHDSLICLDEEKRALGLLHDENTEDDCDWVIWAVGIQDTHYDANLHNISSAPSPKLVEWLHRPGSTPQPTHETFDFVHIRFQPNMCSEDGALALRTAFERTKPNGWIEIVEPLSSSSSSAPCVYPYRSANRRISIARVKAMLSKAGFVDVEEKTGMGARRRGGWEKLKRAVLGWVWGGKGMAGEAEKGERMERIFVIARKPL